ncbi:hypothetical protein J6590_035444 [Homalodisca vitripennis]|nr:hypothetical protein J6590_035444 [Homalodisca vitripennis]
MSRQSSYRYITQGGRPHNKHVGLLYRLLLTKRFATWDLAMSPFSNYSEPLIGRLRISRQSSYRSITQGGRPHNNHVGLLHRLLLTKRFATWDLAMSPFSNYSEPLIGRLRISRQSSYRYITQGGIPHNNHVGLLHRLLLTKRFATWDLAMSPFSNYTEPLIGRLRISRQSSYRSITQGVRPHNDHVGLLHRLLLTKRFATWDLAMSPFSNYSEPLIGRLRISIQSSYRSITQGGRPHNNHVGLLHRLLLTKRFATWDLAMSPFSNYSEPLIGRLRISIQSSYRSITQGGRPHNNHVGLLHRLLLTKRFATWDLAMSPFSNYSEPLIGCLRISRQSSYRSITQGGRPHNDHVGLLHRLLLTKRFATWDLAMSPFSNYSEPLIGRLRMSRQSSYRSITQGGRPHNNHVGLLHRLLLTKRFATWDLAMSPFSNYSEPLIGRLRMSRQSSYRSITQGGRPHNNHVGLLHRMLLTKRFATWDLAMSPFSNYSEPLIGCLRMSRQSSYRSITQGGRPHNNHVGLLHRLLLTKRFATWDLAMSPFSNYSEPLIGRLRMSRQSSYRSITQGGRPHNNHVGLLHRLLLTKRFATWDLAMSPFSNYSEPLIGCLRMSRQSSYRYITQGGRPHNNHVGLLHRLLLTKRFATWDLAMSPFSNYSEPLIGSLRMSRQSSYRYITQGGRPHNNHVGLLHRLLLTKRFATWDLAMSPFSNYSEPLIGRLRMSRQSSYRYITQGGRPHNNHVGLLHRLLLTKRFATWDLAMSPFSNYSEPLIGRLRMSRQSSYRSITQGVGGNTACGFITQATVDQEFWVLTMPPSEWETRVNAN